MTDTRVVHQPVSGAAHPGLVEDCALCAARRGPATPDVDLPGDAVQAAARAMYAELWPDDTWESEPLELILEWRDQARLMLAAALPAIRRHIADEIDLARYGFGGCTDEYLEGMRMGARVARGGSDADL